MVGSPDGFRLVFLADTQLGCYATFSGFSDENIEQYAQMGMKVGKAPSVEGLEWDANRYRQAVEVINATRPALVVIGGDLIDDANSEEQTETFLEITSTIDPEIPVRWVPGNHDIAPDSLIPTPESIRAYRDVFGSDYYSFRMHDTLFVALNTTVIDHPENVPGEWEAQLGFLRDELDVARRSDTEHVVALGHHPLFLERGDEPDSYWNLPTERRRVILDLFHKAGVRFGFAGHWHRNAIGIDGGFTQVTSGPVGYPLGDDPSGYRVVEITAEEVAHEYHSLDEP